MALTRCATLLALLASCSAEPSDAPRAEPRHPPPAGSTPPVYSDPTRGFTIRLPVGVSVQPFEGGARLVFDSGGGMLAVAHLTEQSDGVSAYTPAMHRAAEGCVEDDPEWAGGCPDSLDHEGDAIEGVNAAGYPYLRFMKEQVLVAPGGARRAEAIGPYWLVDLGRGTWSRGLLLQRPEPGAFGESSIETIEAIVDGISPRVDS